MDKASLSENEDCRFGSRRSRINRHLERESIEYRNDSCSKDFAEAAEAAAYVEDSDSPMKKALYANRCGVALRKQRLQFRVLRGSNKVIF